MKTLFSKQIHIINGSNKITIEIDENTTFNSLIDKFNIQNVQYIYVYNTAANHKIIYPGYFHIKLKDYNIQKDYIIKFIKNKVVRREMQIFIKNEFTNATRTLTFYPNTSIEYVKNQIYNYEGIPIDKQNLYYGIYRLENDKYLTDYNITKEATLRLSGRLLSCYIDDIPKIHYS